LDDIATVEAEAVLRNAIARHPLWTRAHHRLLVHVPCTVVQDHAARVR
jgi:hypothetical protein